MILDCFHTFRRRIIMPLYMDIHHKIEGLTADAVMHAHEADVKTQEKYDVQYLKYWFESDLDLNAVRDVNPILVGLHNSWTPSWYKKLSQDQVLQNHCLLSRTLCGILDISPS